MPRYFFDVHTNGNVDRDEIGTEFETLEEVRKAAQSLLPAVGYEEIPKDGDRCSLTVLVTDEVGHPVFTATLNYAGLWLTR